MARGPIAVSRYLLPNERQMATVRRHPNMLTPYITEALGGITIASALSATAANTASSRLIIWTGAALLVGQCIRVMASWSQSYLCITTERVMMVTGVIRTSVTQCPLDSLTDVGLYRSWRGRRFGYGTFIKGADRRQVLFDYVPYPEQLYLLLCGMLFPSGLEEASSNESEL